MARFLSPWHLVAVMLALTPLWTYGARANQVVAIQFIDVCGTASGGGTSCAPDTSAQVNTYVQYADAIFAQAGIVISPVSTINRITINQLTNPTYGACGAAAASTFCTDSSSSSLFDTVHLLIDTPGHGQSTDPQTLNVFLVNNLVATTNGVATTAKARGWGLIGGNGLVVATGINGGFTAAVDTVAHELGHNLGLYHASDPTNLMTSGTRTSPVALCEVGVYTCASVPIDPATGKPTTAGTAALDVLSNSVPNSLVFDASGNPVIDPATGKQKYTAPFVGQIAELQTPLVLKQLPSITTKVPGFTTLLHPIGCDTTGPSCITTTVSAASQAGLLRDVKFRFLDPGVSVASATFYHLDRSGYQVNDTGITAAITSGLYTSIDKTKHVQWIVTPSTSLPPDEYIEISYTYPGGSPNPCGAAVGIPCSPVYDYTPPFSSAFDFVNGITSTAGYDLATGAFSSDQGQAYAFDPNAPGLVPGPSILPTGSAPDMANCPAGAGQYGCWEETDNQAQPLSVFDATPPSPYADSFVTADVPEPPSWLIFAAALSALVPFRVLAAGRGSGGRPAV